MSARLLAAAGLLLAVLAPAAFLAYDWLDKQADIDFWNRMAVSR